MNIFQKSLYQYLYKIIFEYFIKIEITWYRSLVNLVNLIYKSFILTGLEESRTYNLSGYIYSFKVQCYLYNF